MKLVFPTCIGRVISGGTVRLDLATEASFSRMKGWRSFSGNGESSFRMKWIAVCRRLAPENQLTKNVSLGGWPSTWGPGCDRQPKFPSVELSAILCTCPHPIRKHPHVRAITDRSRNRSYLRNSLSHRDGRSVLNSRHNQRAESAYPRKCQRRKKWQKVFGDWVTAQNVSQLTGKGPPEGKKQTPPPPYFAPSSPSDVIQLTCNSRDDCLRGVTPAAG
jgi:hypothetical protein